MVHNTCDGSRNACRAGILAKHLRLRFE